MSDNAKTEESNVIFEKKNNIKKENKFMININDIYKIIKKVLIVILIAILSHGRGYDRNVLSESIKLSNQLFIQQENNSNNYGNPLINPLLDNHLEELPQQSMTPSSELPQSSSLSNEQLQSTTPLALPQSSISSNEQLQSTTPLSLPSSPQQKNNRNNISSEENELSSQLSQLYTDQDLNNNNAKDLIPPIFPLINENEVQSTCIH